MAGRMGVRLMAIVAIGDRGRLYLSPTVDMEAASKQAVANWIPEQDLIGKSGDQLPLYGMKQYWQLYTTRQLVTLNTFSDLIQKARAKVKNDALEDSVYDDPRPLREGGFGPIAYAEAVSVYLAMGVSKLSDYNSSLVLWSPGRDQAKATFARQALPMVWHFTEINPFAEAAGDLLVSLGGISKALLELPASQPGDAEQQDAAKGDFQPACYYLH